MHNFCSRYLYDSKINLKDIEYIAIYWTWNKKYPKLRKVPLHVTTSYKLPRCQFFHNLSSFQFFRILQYIAVQVLHNALPNFRDDVQFKEMPQKLAYLFYMYNENPKSLTWARKPKIGRSDNESTISYNIMLFLCTF